MSQGDISILGLGWVGHPLALSLSNSFSVKGSVTSTKKATRLSTPSLNCTTILLDPHKKLNPENPFFQSETLIVTIPFKRSLKDPTLYTKTIQNLLHILEKTPIKRLIVTSSTSIYPEIGTYTESTPFTPETTRAKALFEMEKSCLNTSISTQILRLAGLYGYDRQPGKFLSKKGPLTTGKSPVNLIHRDDVIGIIKHILRLPPKTDIINAVSDKHPTKQEFYNFWSKSQKQPQPIWNYSGPTPVGKTVLNNKLTQEYGYSFIFPDPMDPNQP